MGLFDFFKKNKNETVEDDSELLINDDMAETDLLTDDELFDEESNIEIKKEENEVFEKIEKDIKEISEEEVKTIDDIEDAIEEIIDEECIINDYEDSEEIIETIEEEETVIVEEGIEETILDDSEDIEEITEDIIEDVEEEITEEITEDTEEEPVKKISLFEKLKRGLGKTKDNIVGGLDNVLNAFSTIDEDLYEEIEETLIMADLGVETSVEIVDRLREKVKKQHVKEVSKVRELIIEIITEILEENNEPFNVEPPTIILVIGVNGVGKTTTIGKLTHKFISEGKTVQLGAADTFRAAAIDQLQVWADRSKVNLIKHQENSDPAAVVFDSVKSAKARKTDVLIIDTAGRLHNKKNLMEELKKINRIIEREYPEANLEVLLALDSTTGQNAMQQAKQFNEVAKITGLILTKLDGTAKGGIVVSIKNQLNIPVRFIGIGEKIDDLELFDANLFAKALFDTKPEGLNEEA